MQIKQTILSADQLKPLYQNAMNLEFGRQFTDYMFTMKFDQKNGWHDAEIKPYQPIQLDPAARVLHYAQEIFEGQKAFKSENERVLLFRPQDNARRLNYSLQKLAMPELPEEYFLQAEKELISLERRWIPKERGAALYIRPTVIATEAALGVAPASEYLFFIICSPVGPYFREGFKPVRIYVSDLYCRAAPGGMGNAKAGGNYAASLLATKIAKENNCSQVLFLDSCQKRYIEELGGMNVFFVIKKKLVTPPLGETILAGITRDSLLCLVRESGIECEERPISIEEVLTGIESGELQEAFACGTAAVVAPIGTLFYKGKDYRISSKSGELTTFLYNELTAIQYGMKPDRFNWCLEI